MADTSYPRPDFVRAGLHWESLNGAWDFIFDDGDVGLQNRWQDAGLPSKIAVEAVGGGSNDGLGGEGDSITQRIAAGTQELLPGNALSRESAIINRKRQIHVPYVFQCPASGINDRGVHQVLWYERSVADLRSSQEKDRGDKLLLRFGAVDYEARVWVNGREVGGHRGGHVPFDIDVTDAVDQAGAGPHRITIRVYDSAYDLTQPRGKQYWGARPESIFYTPSGGIWQSVWLEVAPGARIADSSHGTVLQSNDIDSGTLHCHVAVLGRRVGRNYSIEMESWFGAVSVSKSGLIALPNDKDSADVELKMRMSENQKSSLLPGTIDTDSLQNPLCWKDGVALWSPEHPLLYDITINLIDTSTGNVLETVKTSTGMRSIEWQAGDGYWRLNGKPYFQALCLDQGYWPETFMTGSSDEIKHDIELAKKMGFNGCRKHQKVEGPLFYYFADKLGYLVWAEMANAYQFSREYIDRFNQEWVESVKLAINHPSVVTWTPVNESWAYTSLQDSVEQRNHIRALYFLTRSLDSTRSINDNCGWEHVHTDLTTFHDYSDGPELAKTCASLDAILDKKAGRHLFVPAIEGLDQGAQHVPGTPIMCTEFGGVNIAPAKDSGENVRDWGYTTASNSADLLTRFEKLVRGVTDGGHCCAFVYTQLTDIEQEANGLYTFDRTEKLSSERVKCIIDESLRQWYERISHA
ncbi:glycoside hydrolase family 2 protein [Metarhizium robertsii]|uniref:Glycoside hydrolase family 2 n=2 Tax=Metarhizium robertsii TaxID=568076 RepID=E9ES48_METRA|nr:glycoside hydrolase family 2 [Metarhizium robertsii ARSEF 23]EFZ01565.2 glycoside hydrolase family 2 [Metarhizium robertsii ARSEF 23]EXV01398.1 glycoside hydrolase family 2 protein [Metarhizium robertsii]